MSENALYALTLLGLRGVGRRTAIAVMRAFPSSAELLSADRAGLEGRLDPRTARTVAAALDAWADAADRAKETITRHVDKGITVVAYGDALYPPRLALSPDPPAVFYAIGDLTALTAPLMVAVVGTREPTQAGREVARRIGRRFAEAGAVVVSGLAKGIDTAAHEGALEGGRTIAVLGTPLDKVYPAENRNLFERITTGGTAITEYPLGHESRATAFVERDRIQAWLSAAVVPVQTGVVGGTQHTIKFARDGGRALFCPQMKDGAVIPQETGIAELLRTGEADSFIGDDIPEIVERLEREQGELLNGAEPTDVPSTGKRARKQTSSEDQMSWLLPDDE